jgi:hypothetical protein
MTVHVNKLSLSTTLAGGHYLSVGDAFHPMTDLIRAYFDPNKHAQEIPVDMIVSDDKVDVDYLEKMKNDIPDPTEMKAIVVIKHPKEDAYTVLDGHHRFAMLRDTGCDTIRAAVVDDYLGLGFHLTKIGAFQPTPAFTKHIRVPLKRWIGQMELFLRDPKGQLRKQPPVPEGETCDPLEQDHPDQE